MNRSRKYVFVPFCLLSQGIRADGIVKKYSSIVKPVVSLLMDYDINIVQMPCPELIFDGFHRRPCQKPKYDNEKNRKVCREVGDNVVKLIQLFQINGCDIKAILGIDYSPSCAVKLLTGRPPKRIRKGKGIFVEELQSLLRTQKIKIPFIGVQIYKINETLKDMEYILEER